MRIAAKQSLRVWGKPMPRKASKKRARERSRARRSFEVPQSWPKLKVAADIPG
jgi:hypothetical protein